VDEKGVRLGKKMKFRL